jgi:hypothetical protein
MEHSATPLHQFRNPPWRFNGQIEAQLPVVAPRGLHRAQWLAQLETDGKPIPFGRKKGSKNRHRREGAALAGADVESGNRSSRE